MFNGINKQYGAGRRVVFGGTRDLEGGHVFDMGLVYCARAARSQSSHLLAIEYP
jgi:hypothetical protein